MKGLMWYSIKIQIWIENDNTSFASYRPTSFGEELDLWFEIDFEVKDEQITAIFDVNM